MSTTASLDSFIDKWRQRWPEWGLAAVFVPAALRGRLAAWQALQQELHEAAWGGQDPTPGLAKLAWWQEELRGWSRGARRHPLGDALQKLDAQWDALGRALAALPATRDPADPRADHTALRTFAVGVLACDSDLFGAPEPAPETVDAMVEALRVERALVQGDLAMAQQLAPALARLQARPLSRPRRLHLALLGERLRQLGRGGAVRVAPLRTLRAAWRAARG